jgi:hypothetical protein
MASVAASVVRKCPECQRRLAEQHAATLASLARTRAILTRITAKQAQRDAAFTSDHQLWALWLEGQK